MNDTNSELLLQLLAETRRTNSLLALAFSDSIEQRVRSAASNTSSRVVLGLLAEGEVTIDLLQNAARSRGVARTTLYRLLGELERVGMVERPRRGVVSLSAVVVPYASGLRSPKDSIGGVDISESKAVE